MRPIAGREGPGGIGKGLQRNFCLWGEQKNELDLRKMADATMAKALKGNYTRSQTLNAESPTGLEKKISIARSQVEGHNLRNVPDKTA